MPVLPVRSSAKGRAGNSSETMRTFSLAEVAALPETVFGAGDSEEIRDAPGHVANAQGITDLAQSIGFSCSGLYKALSEDGNPSFETVSALLKALGVRLSVSPVHVQ